MTLNDLHYDLKVKTNKWKVGSREGWRGAKTKYKLGEGTRSKAPGLGQWLMISPLPSSNAALKYLLTTFNCQPLRSWHSFWLVQFSESMKCLLKNDSAVLTHTLTHNLVLLRFHYLFIKMLQKNMIATPELIRLRTTIFKAEFSLLDLVQ